MSCLCSDSVFNRCLGSMRLQFRQWCVKRAWIKNMAKATGIPPMYQPIKILTWVPVCRFACPCLRPTVRAAVSLVCGGWFCWPWCILELVRTPSLVHEPVSVMLWLWVWDEDQGTEEFQEPAFHPVCHLQDNRSAFSSLCMGQVKQNGTKAQASTSNQLASLRTSASICKVLQANTDPRNAEASLAGIKMRGC